MGLTRAFIDIPLDTRRDIVLALARDLEAILRDRRRHLPADHHP